MKILNYQSITFCGRQVKEIKKVDFEENSKAIQENQTWDPAQGNNANRQGKTSN
jgi:methyl coenzyme M reductase gamma subunit